ncbi:MAG: hypothetical protein R3C05_30015 [Pirellulaceae bacterium]
MDRGRFRRSLAEEIAARTVSKQRREEGRTPNETTQGTGSRTPILMTVRLMSYEIWRKK